MSAPPKRRVRVTVNGHAYTVEVGDLNADPLVVTVNGQPYVVKVETLAAEPAPAQALETVARTTSAPSKVPVPPGPAGPAVKDVRAPMPGNIGDIAVKTGDAVSFGQTLCVLEAMKMKSAIRSPRDGVIATVEVEAGQSVAYGKVLFTFREG
jgi:biotin carboxyl carrier protein